MPCFNEAFKWKSDENVNCKRIDFLSEQAYKLENFRCPVFSIVDSLVVIKEQISQRRIVNFNKPSLRVSMFI